MFDKLFSIRVWLLCGFIAGLIATPIDAVIPGAWGPVFPVLFVVAIAVYAWSPWTTAVCPYCRKRVKLGASVCHHCGREVVGQ